MLVKKIKNYASLLKDICKLDIYFIFILSLTPKQKLDFIIKRNFYLLRHFFSQKEFVQDKINVLGENIFFDYIYSLFFYQNLFVTGESFFKHIKKNEVRTVVDVGANIGLFSKTIRHFFPSAKIYAIEPVPSARVCLDKNFEHDSLFQSDQVALSNKRGKLKMISDKTSTQNSTINDSGNLLVSAMTLDEYVKKNNISRIDLLKIDTETFEAHVLKGGSKALRITKYLLIEICLVNNNNYTFSSLCALLFSKNYNFQLIKLKRYSQNEDRDVLFDGLFVNTIFDKMSTKKI